MSRSKPEDEIQMNPCTKWFTWDGGDGKGMKEYNKETKKNEIVPLPFRFLVLDRLYTATGYNEPEKIGYYANEVRNIKDKLVVRSKNGIECEGTWEDVKGKLGSKGLDFAQSVYIAFFDQNMKLTLGNIKMKGATLGPWFDFCKANDIMKIGINIKESKEAKKGRTVYFEPVFSAMPIKEETNKLAVEIDKELQAFLASYLQRNPSSTQQTGAEAKAEEKPVEVNVQIKEAPKDDWQKAIEAGTNSDVDAVKEDDEDLAF